MQLFFLWLEASYLDSHTISKFHEIPASSSSLPIAPYRQPNLCRNSSEVDGAHRDQGLASQLKPKASGDRV